MISQRLVATTTAARVEEAAMAAASRSGLGALRTAWDAVVIGAGPAGSLAARQLARSGVQTLLIDRQQFPRVKVCGGCVNGRALSVLRSVGLGHLFRTLPAVPLHCCNLRCEGESLHLDLPTGFVVARSEFDAALVGAAIEAGAVFLSDTIASVENTTASPSGLRRVKLQQRGLPAKTITTRVVVAADGLGHPICVDCNSFPAAWRAVLALASA